MCPHVLSQHGGRRSPLEFYDFVRSEGIVQVHVPLQLLVVLGCTFHLLHHWMYWAHWMYWDALGAHLFILPNIKESLADIPVSRHVQMVSKTSNRI